MRSHHQRLNSDCSTDSAKSHSQSSCHTHSTAPTAYSPQQSIAGKKDEEPSIEDATEPPGLDFCGSNTSLESYESSRASEDDVANVPAYQVPEQMVNRAPPLVYSATTRDFAELFPSSRRLLVRHDDTTMDGNMNLRVDTPVKLTSGVEKKITLFHLRMYDLKDREFSLRRYCRDSGREICHTARKSQKSTIGRRPGVHHSLSNAIATLRSRADLRSNHSASLKRQDSGYDSFQEGDLDTEERPASSHSSKASAGSTSDLINLKFSNYAHVDVRRRGFKADKRYDFEFWGFNYYWQRSTKMFGGVQEVSYHLIRRKDGQIVGHIMPEPLTPSEAQTETEMGGWIPPCSMWINDTALTDGQPPDIAEVAVASGLTSLVDDSIRRRFHARETTQLIVPLPMKTGGTVNRNHVGPKRLIDEAFGRHKSSVAAQ